VNCSLCFLFSAGTKLLCSGLGKELGRAAYNTADNRFIPTTECLLIFSQLTNLEMTIKFDVATCIDHVTRSQNIHVEFKFQVYSTKCGTEYILSILSNWVSNFI